MDEEKDLCVFTESLHRFQHLLGQSADTENDHAAGKFMGPLRESSGGFQKLPVQVGSTGISF